MLSRHLQQRYLAPTWAAVVDRLIAGPIWRQHKSASPSVVDTEKLEWALSNRVFIPAGNTLAFGGNASNQVLRPNCAIRQGITPQAAKRLWEEGTGFGTTIDTPDTDPVEHLGLLQETWDLHTRHPTHRPRRGNMYVYPANGKSIMDFIRLKADPDRADLFRAFNVSVGFWDFEEDVARNPALLPAIAEAAWRTGDPGVVFLDRVNKDVPLVHRGKTVRTLVPCGEQGMFDGETCTLGSINLNAPELQLSLPGFAGGLTHRRGLLNYIRLEKAVRVGVRFLDNAVDTVETCVHPAGGNKYRRIGLGVMGWADYLKRIEVPYESIEAVDIAKEVSQFIGAVARHESGQLAKEKGGAFPAWTQDQIYVNFAKERQDVDVLLRTLRTNCAEDILLDRSRHGMRNLTVTCVAPTGGINLLAHHNQGFAIEPTFADAPRVSVSAHLAMVDAWQSGMCNSVSKTVNFANTCEPQEFLDAICEARKHPHIKALSMYRLGSRKMQPM